MLLRNTQNAVAELAANHTGFTGSHTAPYMTVGRQGMPMGLEQFIPGHHDVADIKPMSLLAEVTEEDYVPVVQPHRPLQVNVVMHCDPEQARDPEPIVWGRKIVMNNVFQGLHESLLFLDTAQLYVVGEKDKDFVTREAIHVPETEESEAAANAVANLSLSGLTVVLSTFRNLPLDVAANGRRLKNLVGVKTEHTYDHELGRNSGTWHMHEPGFEEVRTKDKPFGGINRQLAKYHERQRQRHVEIMERMQGAGLKMAEAIFDKEAGKYNFDVKAADKSIAKAIKQTARRR